MKEMGYRLGNLDATIILQKPKVSPHKEAIRRSLCAMLGADVDGGVVNVKAKTHEKVCHAVAHPCPSVNASLTTCRREQKRSDAMTLACDVMYIHMQRLSLCVCLHHSCAYHHHQHHHRWTQSEKVAPSRAMPSSCSFAMVSSRSKDEMNYRTTMHRYSIQRKQTIESAKVEVENNRLPLHSPLPPHPEHHPP